MNRVYNFLLVTGMGLCSPLNGSSVTFTLKKGHEVLVSQKQFDELKSTIPAPKLILINGKVSLPKVNKEPFEDLISNLATINAGQEQLENFFESYHSTGTREEYWAMIATAYQLGITKLLEAALLFASKKGYADNVAWLIRKGVNLSVRDGKGKTPLHWAAQWGNQWNVRSLLEKGASVDSQDNSGQTALMCALYCGNEDVVSLLIEKGSQIEASDKKGRTCLIRACIDGSIEMVELLLAEGALVDAQDNSGRTALMEASSCGGNAQIIKVLLNAHASVDRQDKEGKTALMGAALWGEKENVEVLLAAQARVDIQDAKGDTAVDYASKVPLKDLLSKAPTAPPLRPDPKKGGLSIERGLLLAWACYLSYELYLYYHRQSRVGDGKDDLEALHKPVSSAYLAA